MGEDRQATFGSDGSLDTETPPEAREGTTDWGEPKADGETDGGYNRYDVSSLLQKAVRRSDEEVAAWAAWELARSGYAWNLWDRLNLYVVEDLRAGQNVALLVERYETLATDRWEPDSWKGRVCAIHAALACARAESSREASNADEFFRNAAAARAEARESDDDPAVDFPVGDLEVGGEFDVAFDKHTADGSRLDRGDRFFKLFGARVGPEGEDEQSARWQRLNMALSDIDYDEAEVAHAVEPVSPDDRWSDPMEFDGDNDD
ncbi:hypothetical protein C499_01165 [Halogeometricum borinquense DSM 11551]|uniref:Uncharacterized protein n=2 Tax=Halogeometricum borinquense TaxID=60847 RepID=E4NLU3_HALBP|nr:hypothetical protein [Halogeometricum borinquense]ADQ68393.1 hypothetical protein Hbor_28520 [Halogeometricum borinquense DSM 11551]ELY31355.1 hypothetical protein C499_01165 [Halogeometricum borinquense DSM 11551]RYJ15264.1 hypothetical protein ELS19_15800 [Halogeometricum borinquense]